MKRKNNLYEQVYNIYNLERTAEIAALGKAKQYGVIEFRQHPDEYLMALYNMLRDKTYKTSPYTIFKIHEPKERIIYRLPFFPDRILHHAVMNILERIFVATFTADTYSCIKKRGIHALSKKVRKYLKNIPETTYCLKLDITKFYPSVDHAIIKQLLRRIIKDKDLLWLLDEIIDSAPGLPIGNYLSQYLANFYLSYFDHWLKEVKRVKYYVRYADDLVILHNSKAYLHALRAEIQAYLYDKLHLLVKGNYQVFKVEDRGIDVVGYKHFHNRVLIRKSIKKNFARAVKARKPRASIDSYKGWAKHANSKHLLKTLFPNESI